MLLRGSESEPPQPGRWQTYATQSGVGRETARLGYAEYHASCSRTASFMLRHDNDKLIYHMGMLSQVSDLEHYPQETRGLVSDRAGIGRVRELEALLREICDPEAVDARCKADQRARAMAFGGNEAVRSKGTFVRTPQPGVHARLLRV